MTKTRRVINIARAVIMIFLAVILIGIPDRGILIVLMVTGIGMTFRGISTLLYYFTMARSMVGGKAVLYRGLIFLDLGVFTSSIADAPDFYVVLYVAAINAFAGLISLLRIRDSKAIGSSRWKLNALYGVVSMVLAVLVIVYGFVLKKPDIVVYVYAAGLVYAAAASVADAFRRTAIVYIQ